MTPPVSARAAALEAIRRAQGGDVFLRDTLHAVFRETSLDARDRALATQLAAGVIRHRRTLRLVISHARGAAGRATSIQPHILDVLELGALQLLFLDRVPAYAAVSEAVDMARSASRGHAARKAAGFVNGVLRGIGRLVRGHDPQAALARDALPHPDGGAVRLTEPILPDPADGLPAFLGAAYSLPDWLVASWLEAHGDAAEAICRWSNRRPRTFARVHAGQADRAADLPPGPLPGTVDASHLEPETLERLIADGVLTVQDPSAMAAVDALAPRAGESVLDLCASPGTKTMQIAEATGAGGRVVACDRSDEKLDPLRRAVAAQHVAGATVCLASDAAAAAPPGGFDAALVDAPCSNTGVLARRVEARWRLKPGDSDELAAVQRGLVAQAAELVRPGGRLVYSTCSLQPRENGGVVDAFIAEHAGWRLEKSALALPGPDHDGAFWALLVRQS